MYIYTIPKYAKYALILFIQTLTLYKSFTYLLNKRYTCRYDQPITTAERELTSCHTLPIAPARLQRKTGLTGPRILDIIR